jgi:GNAT superfamily N-acetyltransferase
MRTVETIGVQRLTPVACRAVAHLTTPMYAPMLLSGDRRLEPVAVIQDGTPVALAVSTTDDGTDHILTVAVEERARRQGHATMLVRHLLETAHRVKRPIVGEFIEDRATPHPVRGVLHSAGFDRPRRSRVVARFGQRMYDAVLSPAATDREHPIGSWHRLPADYSFLSWTRCTDEMRSELRDRLALMHVYPDVDPFLQECNCEPLTSFALLRRQRIVGWVIGHRTAQEVLRQTVSYIDPALERRGLMYPAYYELVTRIVERLGPETTMICTADLEHAAPLAAVIRRRWGQWADDLKTSWVCTSEPPGVCS